MKKSKIRKILEKYIDHYHDFFDIKLRVIREKGFDKLEKELIEYVVLENWKFLEHVKKCKDRMKKAKKIYKK